MPPYPQEGRSPSLCSDDVLNEGSPLYSQFFCVWKREAQGSFRVGILFTGPCEGCHCGCLMFLSALPARADRGSIWASELQRDGSDKQRLPMWHQRCPMRELACALGSWVTLECLKSFIIYSVFCFLSYFDFCSSIWELKPELYT